MTLLTNDAVPVISTCHVNEITAQALDRGDKANPWTVVAPYEHGWFIAVQPEELHADLQIPDALSAVMVWANAHGARWVRLDCDGDVIEGLQTFEW
jgi:hypothetical protein